MSALRPKADMCSALAYVPYVPRADSNTATERKVVTQRHLKIDFGMCYFAVTMTSSTRSARALSVWSSRVGRMT